MIEFFPYTKIYVGLSASIAGFAPDGELIVLPTLLAGFKGAASRQEAGKDYGRGKGRRNETRREAL